MVPESVVNLLSLAGGMICLLGAGFGDRLVKKLGWQALSDWFITPRYRQAARWREGCGRLALGLLGVSLLLQRFGQFVLAPPEVILLVLLSLGSAGFLILAMIVVTIAAGFNE
jgi:hypothetical protein